LLCDALNEFDGLELIVFLVNIDKKVEDPKAVKTLVARSMLQRGIMRAQYHVTIIKKFLEDGWLQFLSRVTLQEEKNKCQRREHQGQRAASRTWQLKIKC